MIDLPDSELQVLKIFNDHGVRYLIIGGCAMQFWGMEDRIAEDIDIWIDMNEQNATLVFAALIAAGIKPSFPVGALMQPNKQIRPFRSYLDLVTSLNGAAFESAYADRTTERQEGLDLPVIAPRDLLMIKREASKDPKRTKKEMRDIKFLEDLIARSEGEKYRKDE